MKRVTNILIAVIIAMTMVGCKTKYIETERVHDVYHHTIDTLRDSIFHDVQTNVYIKGDTVYSVKTEYLYRDRWRTHDSILVQKDTIPQIVEVEVPAKTKSENVWWWIVIAIAGWGSLIYVCSRQHQ